MREVLEQQRAVTENLQRQLKVVCPRVFHRSGRPIKSFRVTLPSACKEAGCRGRVPARLPQDRWPQSRPRRYPGVSMQMTGDKTRSGFERYNIVSVGDLREASRHRDGDNCRTIEEKQQSASKV